MSSTKDKIAGMKERRFKTFADEFGNKYRIRSLTDLEIRKIRRSLLDKEGKSIRSRMEQYENLVVANCLVEADGSLSMTEQDVMDGFFNDVDGAVTSLLQSECLEWSGIRRKDRESDIEAAAKNSEETAVSA